MGVYNQFGTDKIREAEGVGVDFGDFRVKICRAGGHNQKWAKTVERVSRPYKTAIQANALGEEKAMAMMADIYVEAVIKGWETRNGEGWIEGIEGPDGEVMPYTKENVKKVLLDLPDLFAIIQQHAQDISVFQDQTLEADAKN